MKERLSRLLFGNAVVKGSILAALGILANVLSGAYVFDITKNDAQRGQYLDWSSSIVSSYFWLLVVLVAVTALYGVGLTRVEARIEQALKDEQLRAKALEALVDPLIERVKLEITQGKLRSMDEVFRLLGVERDDRR